MKKLFYSGLICILFFELLNVYFIMPMPGSQRMDSIAVAYFLYSWRWVLRTIFFLMLLYGFIKANWKRRWTTLIPIVLVGGVVWMLNFKMSADHMFRQPGQLVFADAAYNKIDSNRLVLGVAFGSVAKAYPIQYLGYHHIVCDSVGDTPVVITYCTVCRTGRVYDPRINGKKETFRLVGMDHFNAMMEDASSGSWWRQVNGEAVAGKLKNNRLRTLFSMQMTLSEWLKLYPGSLIMQRDPSLVGGDPKRSLDYETGNSRSALTGTDTASWKEKSWVLGVDIDGIPKAYDWNMLKAKRMIRDKVGQENIAILLARDNANFFCYAIPDNVIVAFSNDTVIYNGHHYNADGVGIDTNYALKRLPIVQEFWHSWKTFHPGTQQY